MEPEPDLVPGLGAVPARLEDPEWFRRDLRPGVTVCIASHPARTKTYLAEALNSVLQQTVQADAIVVVNDLNRQGAGWTRSRLLESVTTDWIAWLDSDDYWYPHHLERCLDYATQTDAVYVYPWFDGGDPLGHFGLEFKPCTPHHTTMGHIVKTELAQRVGFYPSSDGPFSNEDWLYIVGIAEICCREGLKMVHLPERTWFYRQQGQNTSGQPFQGDARG